MKTVLIIDDDPQYRRLMGELLQTHGWRVFEASDGESGLDEVRKHRPHIVLCDLLMPRSNGFQVCRAIRGDITLRQTKIVVTSGRDFEADRASARDAGADEYLTKPIQPQVLISVLERLGTGTSELVRRKLAHATGKLSPVQLKFWGVRGSIPSPGPGTVHFGGNTSCLEFRAGDEIIILDAGTGLRLLGRALEEEFKHQPLHLTLLLSHTHWDHIQGLPFFRPVYRPQCRLRILGYEGARKSLVNVLSGQMESPYFPVQLDALPSNIQIEELKDMEFQVGQVRVRAWFANHPGICVGYRLFTPDGSVAYFPDNEPHSRPHHKSLPEAADRKAVQAYAEQQEQRMVGFLHGTDVLVLDSQYDEAEYQSHVGWGHGCVDYAVALAQKAKVKKLFLFHHDPEHDDARVEAMLNHARKLVAESNSDLEVEAAREGTTVLLKGNQKPAMA